jgi:hypothetical protein
LDALVEAAFGFGPTGKAPVTTAEYENPAFPPHLRGQDLARRRDERHSVCACILHTLGR